jgi:hypothetical protein
MQVCQLAHNHQSEGSSGFQGGDKAGGSRSQCYVCAASACMQPASSMLLSHETTLPRSCPVCCTPTYCQSLDSPDQRVAQDLPLLTASLSEVLTQLAAVPFNIIWYTHLTRQVNGPHHSTAHRGCLH